MKETLEFLKKDRKVNRTFMDRLEKIGLEIVYDKYACWEHQECVQIGRDIVWLVECEHSRDGNHVSVVYRWQNDVIKDILQTIDEQKKLAEKADELVENFFEKLSR